MSNTQLNEAAGLNDLQADIQGLVDAKSEQQYPESFKIDDHDLDMVVKITDVKMGKSQRVASPSFGMTYFHFGADVVSVARGHRQVGDPVSAQRILGGKAGQRNKGEVVKILNAMLGDSGWDADTLNTILVNNGAALAEAGVCIRIFTITKEGKGAHEGKTFYNAQYQCQA